MIFTTVMKDITIGGSWVTGAQDLSITACTAACDLHRSQIFKFFKAQILIQEAWG